MLTNTILLSFLGGMIPPIIWLWFWLKEDIHPEPKKYIFFTFLAGMISALVVLLVESEIIKTIAIHSYIGLIILASTEEIFKYLFAYFSALKRKFTDEPVDAIIYMITVALGFAAMENVLYLWETFSDGNIVNGIIMSNMRFIGATVLHTVSSATIGVFIALSFYKSKVKKLIYLLTGIILSIALHTSFNFLIINNTSGNILWVFMFIWFTVICLLFIFEKIKKNTIIN